MWDVWWTMWHWSRLFSECFGFPCHPLPRLHHTHHHPPSGVGTVGQVVSVSLQTQETEEKNILIQRLLQNRQVRKHVYHLHCFIISNSARFTENGFSSYEFKQLCNVHETIQSWTGWYSGIALNLWPECVRFEYWPGRRQSRLRLPVDFLCLSRQMWELVIRVATASFQILSNSSSSIILPSMLHTAYDLNTENVV
jgi:hypothetical protein